MEDNGTVLAFGCHPDDIEFMCAGTLSLLKKTGYSVHMATVCGGEMGSTTLSKERIRAVRLKECEDSATVLGASYRWAGWEDIEVEFCHALRVKVAKVIREVNPFLVFTLPPVDYMADHEETSKLVRNACFCASMPNFETEGVPPTKGVAYLYYWDAVEGKDFLGRKTPVGLYVDISREMETKVKTLSCHRSQRDWLLAQHGIDQYIEQMKEWDRRRGKAAGVEYAEAFCQHLGHPFPQDNVLRSLIGPALIEKNEPMALEQA
jgi:LmbE family N-acetylglucosaminyl deacetylase